MEMEAILKYNYSLPQGLCQITFRRIKEFSIKFEIIRLLVLNMHHADAIDKN